MTDAKHILAFVDDLWSPTPEMTRHYANTYVARSSDVTDTLTSSVTTAVFDGIDSRDMTYVHLCLDHDLGENSLDGVAIGEKVVRALFEEYLKQEAPASIRVILDCISSNPTAWSKVTGLCGSMNRMALRFKVPNFQVTAQRTERTRNPLLMVMTEVPFESMFVESA